MGRSTKALRKTRHSATYWRKEISIYSLQVATVLDVALITGPATGRVPGSGSRPFEGAPVASRHICWLVFNSDLRDRE